MLLPAIASFILPLPVSSPLDVARRVFSCADARQYLIKARSRVLESLCLGIRARFQQLIESVRRGLERLQFLIRDRRRAKAIGRPHLACDPFPKFPILMVVVTHG